MVAQFGGPAQFDYGHRAALDTSEMAVMSLSIRLAMAAEDIGHLQSRRHERNDQPGGTTRCSAGRAGSSWTG